jgi:hypothetical protein
VGGGSVARPGSARVRQDRRYRWRSTKDPPYVARRRHERRRPPPGASTRRGILVGQLRCS